MPQKGTVYLVGAGPGDPGLLTLRGKELLEQADCVLYDRLIHPRLLQLCPPSAELIYVGKEVKGDPSRQNQINRLLIEKARQGKIVVRLKGGDPFVFGRGGEEALALVEAGIPFEVVPGVSSAVAVPAYAGIPLTHREFCSAVGLLTGHEGGGKSRPLSRWKALAEGLDAMVFLMSAENLPQVVHHLLMADVEPETPSAIIQWGTWPRQKVVTAPLREIIQRYHASGLGPPAVLMVGKIVQLRHSLAWFERRPLFGKGILVTRAQEQARELSHRLEELGAETIECPVIEIVPLPRVKIPPDFLKGFDWILFTSVNGVKIFFERLFEAGGDHRALGSCKLGAIGPATAQALVDRGFRPDFRPQEDIAERVLEEFPENPQGLKILIPRAQKAREILPEGLRQRGAQVEVLPLYRTEIPSSPLQEEARRRLEQGEIDYITFTSSSTVQHFVQIFGKTLPSHTRVACIGPITAETARSLGLKVHIVPEKEYTLSTLISAIVTDAQNPATH